MIRIQALGGLSVRGADGRPLSGAAAQPRRMAVLALMARCGDRGVTRERLVAMLWPDADEQRARSNLAQALYALRRDLGADDAIAGTKELRLEPTHVAADVTEFCAALTGGRHARAAELYAGPFLEGFHLPSAAEFERWVDEERRALAHDHARVLESLARAATERGNAAEAVAWWRKLAALEPLNARLTVGLMEALVAAGDRAGALRHARVYEVLLEQELDLPPDRAVVALAERLRQAAEAPAAAPAGAAATAAAPSLVAPSGEAPAGAPQTARPARASTPTTDEPRTADEPAGEAAAAGLASAAAPVPASDAPPAEAPGVPGARFERARAEVPHRRAPLLIAVAGVAVAALLGAVLVARARSPEPRLVAGAARRVAFDAALELDPAISPDGKLVVYAADPGGQMRLYVKQVAGGRAVPISAGVDGGYHRAPRWSPDGSRIAFQAGGTIYVVPAFGGVPRPLVRPEAPAQWVAYPAWSPDGETIAYSQEDALFTRAVAGGPPRRLSGTPPAPHSLAWSPDGAWIALVSGNSTFVFGRGGAGSPVNVGNVAPSSLWVVPTNGGAAVRVTEDRALNTSPVWLPGSRSLLFVSNRDGERDVYRVDLGDDGRPLRKPVRVTAGLGAHTIALSRDGRRLVYSAFSRTSNLWEIAIPAGAPAGVADARPLTSGTQLVEGVSVSPDGRRLAFDSDRDGTQDIYTMPVAGGDPVPLTADSSDDFMPAWSPSGREIAFHSFAGRDDDRRVEVVSASGGVPQPVVASPRNQRFPGWSPDGRALVFTSDATGRMELYVVRRDAGLRWGAARRLTTAGGFNGRWAPEGREIAYTRPDGIWAIASDGTGAPRHVLRADSVTGPIYDVVQWAPDGRTLYYKAFDRDGRSTIGAVSTAGCLPGAGTHPGSTRPTRPAVSGCAPRELVRFDDPQRQSTRPEFATDGHHFYFTISEQKSDVWAMELAAAAP